MKVVHGSGRTVAAVTVGLVALLATIAVAPAAQAAFPGYTYFIRPADFVDPTGTNGDAAMSVQSDGAHVIVGNPQGLAAASFTVPDGGIAFSGFNLYGYHVTYDWTGTTAQPGIHYDIDLDGDGRVDLELVGEHQYGDDMWLNPDQPMGHTIAASAIRATAPCRNKKAQHSPLRDGCAASYGSTFHGTILDWITGFSDAGYGNGRVIKGGFVATGAAVDGVLADLHIGINTFTFTTDPPTPATVTIGVDPHRIKRGGQVTVSGQVSNTYNYPHVVLQEKDPGGVWRTVAEQTFTTGSHYTFSSTPAGLGAVRYRTEVPASSYNTLTISKSATVTVTKK